MAFAEDVLADIVAKVSANGELIAQHSVALTDVAADVQALLAIVAQEQPLSAEAQALADNIVASLSTQASALAAVSGALEDLDVAVGDRNNSDTPTPPVPPVPPVDEPTA